ncbi:MAG: MerR family transcriptional regulator, light-induced transcriptional regulator [Actinomycetota bacterium]|nr:MerR family transcriptional regulator, light-induced transcriptional regulator [Actinomycetota bacterium]
MSQEEESSLLRIGELSRRVGVSEHVLRAWENRYGLLKPARSEGGYRLYSADDQSRVRRMQVHLAGGLAAAQAAQAVLAGESPRVDVAESPAALRRALDDLDEPEAQGILDRLLTELTVQSVLRDVVVPYLHELGERWEQGAVSVGQEHFASNVLRGRLSGLARGWGGGRGPQALLACPPNELHDLGLLVFGIVLNRGGWRVEYLGANTPMLDTVQVTSQIRPDVVVLAATTRKRFAAVRPELAAVAELAPLALAGAGATTGCAYQVGARALLGDPVTEAELLSGS